MKYPKTLNRCSFYSAPFIHSCIHSYSRSRFSNIDFRKALAFTFQSPFLLFQSQRPNIKSCLPSSIGPTKLYIIHMCHGGGNKEFQRSDLPVDMEVGWVLGIGLGMDIVSWVGLLYVCTSLGISKSIITILSITTY